MKTLFAVVAELDDALATLGSLNSNGSTHWHTISAAASQKISLAQKGVVGKAGIET